MRLAPFRRSAPALALVLRDYCCSRAHARPSPPSSRFPSPVLAIVSDLIESRIKRRAATKDAGQPPRHRLVLRFSPVQPDPQAPWATRCFICL